VIINTKENCKSIKINGYINQTLLNSYKLENSHTVKCDIKPIHAIQIPKFMLGQNYITKDASHLKFGWHMWFLCTCSENFIPYKPYASSHSCASGPS